MRKRRRGLLLLSLAALVAALAALAPPNPYRFAGVVLLGDERRTFVLVYAPLGMKERIEVVPKLIVDGDPAAEGAAR